MKRLLILAVVALFTSAMRRYLPFFHDVLGASVLLTHRERSSSVTFAAGHETDEKGGSAVDGNLLPKDDPLAVYMGIARVAAIAGELAGAGFSPDTPFAIVPSQEDPGEPAAQSV